MRQNIVSDVVCKEGKKDIYCSQKKCVHTKFHHMHVKNYIYDIRVDLENNYN